MSETQINRKRLYHVGNLSIFMIGLGFAVRANIAPNLQAEIYDKIDLANSAAMVGEALGITFTGFALTLLFGSALVDLIGMKRMLLLSALGYVAGALGLLAATMMPVGPTVETVVLVSLLLTGLGWGAVEAASNPMVAALYPEEKTHRLNILHAWWPAGIVVGGLLGVAITSMGIPWKINMFVLLVPALVLAWMVATSAFPQTERVAAGVSYSDMFAELVKRPLFWVFWVCMFLTAAAELAPGQWVNIALSNIVGMQGILLLVYVSALMFVMRHFAGPIVARISSIGLMFVSCRYRPLSTQPGQYTGAGFCRCDRVGHRRVLSVAHHAGYRVRAFPTRRCHGDGTDGFCRRYVHPVRTAADGQHF